MKLFLRRLIPYGIGVIILALGICLVIRAGIGAGAWDALNIGLSRRVGLTPGIWLIIVGIIVMLLNAILLRKRPDYPAAITVILLGLLLDGWLWLIHIQLVSFGWKLALFLLGLTTMAFGLSIYLQAKFAPTPIDRLMYTIATLTGFSLRISKTIGEVVALIGALLIGGPVNMVTAGSIGWGTLLLTFLIGPLLQFFMRWTELLFRPLVEK